MDPLSQVFCLRWNNHRNNLLNVLDNLLQTEAFCDVTLACDNTSIKCHKMILSACSAYFQKLFFEHPCDHPIVFLKDIKYAEIRAILDYMYKGEVNVAQEELPGLLKVAELLRVKGLVEEEREKLLNSNFIPGGGGSRGEGSGGKSHNSRSNEEPERSAKVNGGGTDHPSRNSVLAELRERERERDRERDRDRDRDRDRERERERERHRERVRSADAAVTKDSPPSTSTPVVPPMVRPFMYTPPPGAPSFPMFPIPGMFPGAQHLFGGSENDKDDSVGSHGAKRKKVASGSGGSSSSKESSGIGNNIKMDRDEHTGPNDLRVMDDKNQGNLSDSEKDSFMGLDKSGIANYVPNQRLEWKRYKQYTRNDIMAAIEEVKQGMSALQASRKYGVPSRTLYDKVKKMGITTGRQMQKKSLPNYPASFPQLGMLGMHESFKDADDREDTNDSSLGVPGDVTDGRATMVPPSGFSIQMLNLMKEMKDSNKSDLPINLSTMLSGVSSRDHNKRHSESSLSPRSPRGHYVGPEDEDEDIDDIDDDDQDREDGVDSSVRRRSRHSSGEIRAQFMADLKRLGGHIPYRAGSRGGSGDEPASSTTVSPPPTNTRLPVPPPLLHVPGEDSLPPRKRKVSQEHQLQQTPDDLTCSSTPYNGIHGNRNATNGGKGNESESSGMSSPEKQERMKDEPLSSPSLPCRN